ncbi:isoprenyl transferase [Pelagibacterium halotolerans]|uniref:Isoprenyl transferase n=1 Tax=Pelagibacterium halotolerans (strain DSM 22347 / JCM 15775 / CGMCC 1.7692 / B2) TaxID=1082931 RepID=G4R8U5_PELHB|nr:isoprenyl transferase [Pelagibacterium halotolerans]AEQ51362.1 Undecaprenyl pyrophosphate synthetase [Pelagibacterium halotolerans B2]QJR18795.1 isoprenyl transferase [Pelagibacterium halotolerans]SEA92974.1 Undecaprenyl pyrophosphate synthetase [Pelagibacterium halotolerans]
MSTHPATASIEAQRGLKIPRHIGVIMDGNGRWAKQRGLGRSEGHKAGVEAVRRIVALAIEYGVDCLTLFSFSAENWRRPPDEVRFIFGLLRRFVTSDLERLHDQNVRIRIIGGREGLERGLRGIIHDVESRTAANTGLDLVIAFNYGAKTEIVNATRAIARKVASGELDPDSIDEATIARHLDTSGLPDPDLILRTSGEMRLSNFLLWQSAYAELVFVEENWPDFDEAVFVRALKSYTARDRRFGGVRT